MKRGTFLLLILLFFGMASCSKDDDDFTGPIEFAGNWTGTFTGDVAGTWKATISEGGIVTGTAVVTSAGIQSNLNGNVDSKGKFKATVGTTSLGYSFDGQLSGKSISGAWKNSSGTQNGTWSGSKD